MGTFKNLGFENNTVDNWVQGGGTWGGGAAPVPIDYLPGGSRANIGAAEISVTSSGTDSRTDNVVDRVFEGAHSALINSASADASVSVLSQHVTDYRGGQLTFAFAAVLEKAHATGEADGFAITVTDTTTGTTVYEVAYDSSTVRGGFTLSSSGWYYQDWQKVRIDTSALAGHDFTVDVIAYDCSLGGHASYVYFDGFDVPTGKIAGTVYQDYDASGAANTQEPTLAGWTVYADADGDGVYDAGEASAVTDVRGRYVLSGVDIGEATIRVDVPAGTWEHWASTPVTVTVTEDATLRDVSLGVTGGAGPGDDVLTGVRQTAETIDGGAGNDLIRSGGGNDLVLGNTGDDTLRGGADQDRLDGGAGRDRISGGDGDDIVVGGAGADRLVGSAGADTFVFADGFGRDFVRDFSHDEGDHIRFEVAGVTGMSDLVFTQDDQNTVITLAMGGGDAIVLRDVLAAGLTASDFVFAPPAEPTFA